jgi:hypothetical protein
MMKACLLLQLWIGSDVYYDGIIVVSVSEKCRE